MIQTVIGQGVSQITPLHVSMITAMIANNGEMMVPYTIERVETADGNLIKQYAPKSLGQLITQEEAAALQEIMSAVVEEGTGTRLRGQSYSAAGKQGLQNIILLLTLMHGLQDIPIIPIIRFKLLLLWKEQVLAVNMLCLLQEEF